MSRIEIYNSKYRHEVIDLILNIQQNEFNVQITLENQPDLESIDDYYKTGNGNFWIAIQNNKVVGTIGLIDLGNGQAALRKMFVHSDYRGKEKGIAQSLYSALVKHCREKNVHEVFLGTIDRFIAASKFYNKNGFVLIPREALPGSFPVMNVDNTFFRLTILSLDKVRMSVINTSPNGVVNSETIFDFTQTDDVVTAGYKGGKIVQGFLVGKMEPGKLHFNYCQVHADGVLDHGESLCDVNVDINGKIMLVERFYSASKGLEGINIFREL